MAPDADALTRWRGVLASYSGPYAYARAARALVITEDELRKWCPPAKPKNPSPARKICR